MYLKNCIYLKKTITKKPAPLKTNEQRLKNSIAVYQGNFFSIAVFLILRNILNFFVQVSRS